jgi:valyl-tRNA synthetase
VRSVGRAPWPETAVTAEDAAAEKAGEAAVHLLTAVRRWRSENKVSPGKRLARVVLRAPSSLLAHLPSVDAELRAAARIDDLATVPDDALSDDACRVTEASVA